MQCGSLVVAPEHRYASVQPAKVTVSVPLRMPPLHIPHLHTYVGTLSSLEVPDDNELS